MGNIAIFGLGRMGQAILYDLICFGDKSWNYYIVDQDRSALNQIQSKDWFSDSINFHEMHVDVGSSSFIDECEAFLKMNSIDLTFGAMDYSINVVLTKACISAGSHFLDLGGNPEIVRAQQSLSSEAEKKGVTIIPDCGLAPGMANLVGYYFTKYFDHLESLNIYVGGLPQTSEGHLKYQQVFSIRGLTNEYIEPAIGIRDGQIVELEPLSGLETVEIPTLGTFEAFITSGGTSNLPKLLKNKINELNYKTIRYQGHMQYIRFLYDFGFFSEVQQMGETTYPMRKLTECLLERHLPAYTADMVVMLITITGQKDDRTMKKSWYMIDYHDSASDFSSMARTTAYPVSILGQMILRGEILKRGVVEAEALGVGKTFLDELLKRNIDIQLTG